MKFGLTAACLGAALLGFSALAQAQDQDAVAQFYKGKELKLYIGSTPGGGYDQYGRLLARHMGEHIPGNPTIIPVNKAGAGSNVLAAYMASIAPKDGTELAIIFPGAILDPLLGNVQAQEDPSKFIYLGSANVEVFVCLVRSDAPVKTYQDAMKTKVVMAASADGGSTRDMPALDNNLLGTKFRVVSGYPGSREINLAIEQGEVQGSCGTGWSSIEAQESDWVSSGKVRLLSQETNRGDPALNAMGVPLSYSFAKTDSDRQILALIYSQEVFGRPFIVPPGVPAPRIAALRNAFMAVLTDKDVIAEAKQQKLDVNPLPGAEVQQLVEKVYATPKDVIARAKAAMVYKDPE